MGRTDVFLLPSRSRVGPVRFGNESKWYYFPPGVTEFYDNFADLRVNTQTIAGMDGSYDGDGYSPAPSEKGEVNIELLLRGETPSLLQAKKDELSAIAGWGKMQLWKQPYDLTLSARWCNARVKRIGWKDQRQRRSDLSEIVQLVFEVPEARWYVRVPNPAEWRWGTEYTWGQVGIKWGGGGGTAFTGSTLTLTITNNGSARTLPNIRIITGAAQTMTNPVIERVVNTSVVDSLLYQGTVSAAKTLALNCAAKSAQLDAIDVYGLVTALNSDWMALEPGANTIRVRTDSASDRGTIKLTYDEAYYK
jgi:hypothetical protein